MRAVTPTPHKDAVRILFAADQPEYEPLPASVDGQDTVMTEWELSAEDLQCIIDGGRIRVWLLHTGIVTQQAVAQGHRRLTPIKVEVVEP